MQNILTLPSRMGKVACVFSYTILLGRGLFIIVLRTRNVAILLFSSETLTFSENC